MTNGEPLSAGDLASAATLVHGAATLEATLAAPPGDPPRPADAQPSVERGALIGRYVVLSRLGAGGMGVVYAAYDPELDRKVALKLLHPHREGRDDAAARQEARGRLVREAQALARLNHPNIVAVHDAGEHGGAIWLAMEYVDGETLAAWLERRRWSWREVVDVLTPAARGIAAAHQAGLVHRDIKPDNIMLGADGRVRVMDLGLARAVGNDPAEAPPTRAEREATGEAQLAAMTRAGALLGTPAYMSPEQLLGQPVDARSDVFSFSVTLWEALMGERPFAGDSLARLAANVLAGDVRPVPREVVAQRVPGWLRRACLRGLAVDPERRHPSMEALLEAIARGRGRTRRWRLLGAGLAAAAVAASVGLYQHREHQARVAACTAAGAPIDALWDEDARARVRDGLLATRQSYAPATAEKVMPFLDAQARAWREHRIRVCVQAEVEGTLDAELHDRAVWCLDERRMELDALVTELARADGVVVQRAVLAAAGLPRVDVCTNGHVLAALPPPPPTATRARADALHATLSQARTLLLAGKYREGLERSRAAIAEAEALAWPPMTAAARQLEGSLRERTGAYAEAEAAARAAFMEAAKARAWDVAAAAAQELIAVVGLRQARHEEGKLWAELAAVAIAFAGDPVGLREAGRLNGLAILNGAAGAFTEAAALHSRALALREAALGPSHPEVAVSLNNLAVIRWNTGDDTEARALYERALVIWEETLGPAHPNVASILNNIANIQVRSADYAAALASYERARVIWEDALGPSHPSVAVVLSNLAEAHGYMGEYDEAKRLNERALTIRETTNGPDHPDVAASLTNLAILTLRRGSATDALPLVERAVAIFEAHPGVQEGEGDAHLALAEALVRAGDRVRGLAEAKTAAAMLRDAGENKAADLAKLENLLAESPDAAE